jgi:hypothetical protein
VDLKSARQGGRWAEIEVACDAAKAKPGIQGNLIFDISAQRTPPANRQRVPRGTLPAVAFEIAAPAVATAH